MNYEILVAKQQHLESCLNRCGTFVIELILLINGKREDLSLSFSYFPGGNESEVASSEGLKELKAQILNDLPFHFGRLGELNINLELAREIITAAMPLSEEYDGAAYILEVKLIQQASDAEAVEVLDSLRETLDLPATPPSVSNAGYHRLLGFIEEDHQLLEGPCRYTVPLANNKSIDVVVSLL